MEHWRFSKEFRSVRYLPAIIVICVSLVLPHFYNQRITTGVFRTDFYLIWIAGGFCWIGGGISKANLHLMGICCLGLVYVLLSYLFNSGLDENSCYAFITLVSYVGIVNYLYLFSKTKYLFHGVIAFLFGYIVQVGIGASQGFRNGWESLAIKGELYNSGFYGNFLAAMIPLLLSGAVYKKEIFLRISFLVVLTIAGILLTVTLARAAYIGVLIGCLYVLYPLQRRISFRGLIALRAIVLVSLLSGIFFLYLIKPESALGRFTIYKVSLNIIKEHPVIGVGPNRFSAVYNNYQSAYFKEENVDMKTQLLAENTMEAFNFILQLLIEYGIVGLFIFIVFVCQVINQKVNGCKIQIEGWLQRGSTGCIMSICVCSFFSNPFHVTAILLILACHLSIVLPGESTRTITFSRTQNKVFASLRICFILFVTLYCFIKHREELVWHRAAEMAKYKDFHTAKMQYERVYPGLMYNGDFLFNYGAEASYAGEYDHAIRLLERAKEYSSFGNLYLFLGDAYVARGEFKLAEKNYLHAIFMTPSHIYPKYQLIQMYKKWNKWELAELWIEKTLETRVKVESIYIEELLKELKSGYGF